MADFILGECFCILVMFDQNNLNWNSLFNENKDVDYITTILKTNWISLDLNLESIIKINFLILNNTYTTKLVFNTQMCLIE